MSSDQILRDLKSLQQQGDALLNTVKMGQYGRDSYIRDINEHQAFNWISQALHLIGYIAQPSSFTHQELNRIIAHESMKMTSVPVHLIDRIYSLLTTTINEINAGRLKSWEYSIAASDFDDFLKNAERYHKSGKHMESSVIASAVLEDTIKKIANKYEVDDSGSMDEIIQRLTAVGVFNAVKKSRIQSYAAIRNKAFHAQWDELDLSDVHRLIDGVRELIDKFLAGDNVVLSIPKTLPA